MYPYCSIGMVSGKVGEKDFYGTGFLIGPNIVLTCAHNCEHEKSPAIDLKFFPAVNGKSGISYKVIQAFY